MHEPPPLPAGLPQDLRDFIECRSDSATIGNGPVTWVDVPDAATGLLGKAPPELTVTPGEDAGTATLRVKIGFVSVTLPTSVAGGKLAIDTSKLPFWAPSSVKGDVASFVDSLNDWLAANGRRLAPPTFSDAGMTLTKVALPPET
jgi:hypothetical protein